MAKVRVAGAMTGKPGTEESQSSHTQLVTIPAHALNMLPQSNYLAGFNGIAVKIGRFSFCLGMNIEQKKMRIVEES